MGKAYAGQQILTNINLEICQGDFVALIGPSGAGKSTLLRLLNFLEPATVGTIFYKGTPIDFKDSAGLLSVKRTMTMVMQRSVMLGGTVADNVGVGLKLRKVAPAQIRAEVKKSLAFVGMTDFAGRQAGTLSGGEVQRVALARAIALQPRILFLDEPTANLDPKNVGSIEGLIADVKERLGTTVVMVTHNMFQARRMAAKVVFMNLGRVVEIGSTEEIFEQPKAALTKQFVSGTMIY